MAIRCLLCLLLICATGGSLHAQYSAVGDESLIQLPNPTRLRFTSLEYSPDGRMLISAHYLDSALRIWDAATGELLRTIGDTSSAMFYHAVFSRDGSKILTSRSNGMFQLFDFATGEEIRRFVLDRFTSIGLVVLNPDATKFVSQGAPPLLWDVETGDSIRLRGHQNTVVGIAFSPDGKYVATSALDTTLRFWDAESGKQQRVVRPIAKQTLFEFGFLPDGEHIVMATRPLDIVDPYPYLLVINVADGSIRHQFSGEWKNGIYSIQPSPDGERVAVAVTTTNYRGIQVLHVETGEEQTRLPFPELVKLLRWSPNGRKMVYISAYDTIARIWTLPQQSAVSGERPMLAQQRLEIRPNPARSWAVISYHCRDADWMRLDLYDPLGQRVAVLQEGEIEAGSHRVDVDLSTVPRGDYYCVLITPDGTTSQRLSVQ